MAVVKSREKVIDIVLASQSPRRKEILEKFGYQVKVSLPKDVQEVELDYVKFFNPEQVVIHNSKIKADSIIESKELMIASDTIVVFNNKAFGKPGNKLEAISFLNELQGNTHQVYSGFCLKKDQKIKTGIDVSEVTFKSLELKQIEDYIDSYHVLDKAGAYAIQDGGDIIIEKLAGSFFNVMGLPIEKINQVIHSFV